MSMHQQDYVDAVKKTGFNLWQWGTAHTFIAGLVIGVALGFVAAKAFF